MSNETRRILLVEDEKAIRDAVTAYLERENYWVTAVGDGQEALEEFSKHHFDLVILDLMLPRVPGERVCRAIRDNSDVPIIMLTAKGEEFDKLLGLELGADDYITKPFSPREVLARVKAVLRRMHELKDSGKASHLVVENLDIDMSAFTVKLDGKLMPCTPKEIEILWTLANNPGMVFSREHLLQSIWGYDFLGDTRAVDSHIKRIRAKLCKPSNHWEISTVWGIGYRFEKLEED